MPNDGCGVIRVSHPGLPHPVSQLGLGCLPVGCLLKTFSVTLYELIGYLKPRLGPPSHILRAEGDQPPGSLLASWGLAVNRAFTHTTNTINNMTFNS
jgi:hypothetical protein